MELEDIFKELSNNQKTLAISFCIHFPMVYVIGYYLYPKLITLDLFPQIMFVSAFSILTVMAETSIALIADYHHKRKFSLFPIIWVIVCTFALCSFLYVIGMLTLRIVIGNYVLFVISSCLIAFRYSIKIKRIKAEVEGKEKNRDNNS